ncbi:unnamed protein product [Vitrella brassicaformis CCMP3155]|uniref:Uncharacterized protein n=1 Tax=Vitrella brassicaformis (strain CCMP3155) TaxID=1169540 RepID=A0A0G4H3U0_VITBC|nr:unnamed protein product [Vitrella brassicaformis CCMP3155]|eukprot:CEM38332.1 unnamed protein product [Vitrella brassicaformis CCMP3155]
MDKEPKICRLPEYEMYCASGGSPRFANDYAMRLIWKELREQGLECYRMVRFVDTFGYDLQPVQLEHHQAYGLWLGPLWSAEKETEWRRDNAPALVKWWRRVTQRRHRPADDEAAEPLAE